jgi:hypothetical protein
VDQVPDPLLFRISCSAENRTGDLRGRCPLGDESDGRRIMRTGLVKLTDGSEAIPDGHPFI